MFLLRRRDGSLEFQQDWKTFRDDWVAADQAHRVVLDDGRPAVRRDPPSLEDKPSYLTIYPNVWESVRHQMKAAFAAAPPAKRIRLCPNCRSEMKVAREFEDVWAFVCDRCKQTDILAKSLIGGTQGAGEREKR